MCGLYGFDRSVVYVPAEKVRTSTRNLTRDTTTDARAAERLARKNGSIADDLAYAVHDFLAGTMPVGQWTHQMHLQIGLYYAWLFDDEEEGMTHLRHGIQALNKTHGVHKGYHETITKAYLKLLRQVVYENPSATLAELQDLVTWCALSDRTALFDFYTKSRLLSDEARQQWVEPDAPLNAKRLMQVPRAQPKATDHAPQVVDTPPTPAAVIETRIIQREEPKKVAAKKVQVETVVHVVQV